MRRWRTISFAAIAVASLPAQTRTLIRPGEPIAVIVAPHLRAYVPAAAAERLAPLVARADQIYGHMQRDAGFVPGAELNLLLADWYDVHNGFSFVVPLPVVQVELAPADPATRGFAGDDQIEHGLLRELATQIANDRNSGVRGLLEQVFGRLVPNDIASLFLWYLSTPAAQTQPRYWQVGVDAWAECTYGNPDSAWRGFGRDPLTQMVWRLDAAAELVPETEDWNANWHEWPFGERAAIYGAAYTRFLDGRFGKRASMWAFVRDHAERWAFTFDGGSEGITGTSHDKLLKLARDALLDEQRAVLAHLRTTPLTKLERRTRFDTLLGAPAWLPGGVLAFAAQPAQGRARLNLLSPAGDLTATGEPMLALANVRALPDWGDTNGVVFHELNWRGTSRLIVDGVQVGRRLLQPDAAPLDGDRRTVVAIQIVDGGGQQLSSFALRGDELGPPTQLPTQGTPWSPALRRGKDHAGELAWVETDASGSRLVLGSLGDPAARTVLWSVRGRILHPAWSHDGAQLFCCADHTGIANAYRITFAGGAARATAITNTGGGVIACVPSPDGKQLALIDHDQRGPFVATMPNDPATDVGSLPTIELVWPAPVEPDDNAVDARALRATPIPALPAGATSALVVEPYSGLREVRPLYWGATTFAVPEGGNGVYGLAADPLFTNVVQAGAGIGPAEQEPVGFFQYDHLAEPIEFGVRGSRSERTFAETVQLAGALLDYTEVVAGGEVRIGRGVFSLERQFRVYASIGAEHHDEVDESAARYVGGTYQKPPFRDTDGYIELTVGYDDSTYFPTSYAREDGFTTRFTYRYSGLFGDLERNRALADVSYTWSILPRAGHQIVVRSQAGWSDGDDTLQGNFTIGGGLTTALPRGYIDEAVDTGRHLIAGSLAYRLPLWRPFTSGTPAPLRARQIIAEVFGDTAQVGDEQIGDGGDWYTSVGAELFAQTEFADGVSPGIGIAFQLDGNRDVRFYFSLGVTL